MSTSLDAHDIEALHAKVQALEAQCEVDQQLITALQAQSLADHAKIANLETALQSSRQIGAAVGIVMALRRVSQDDAFALLSKASQNTKRKLRDIAADVRLTGALPFK